MRIYHYGKLIKANPLKRRILIIICTILVPLTFALIYPFEFLKKFDFEKCFNDNDKNEQDCW